MTKQLRVAARVPCTTAEGPGKRYALWLQGCQLRCPGCCNPEMFSRHGGSVTTASDLLAEVALAQTHQTIEGMTVLGGEPLEQIPALTELLEGVQARGLGVLVFTGHQLADAAHLAGFDRLWAQIDTLVDGRFDATQREPTGGRRWIGSRNQTIHHRTPRYRAPRLWHGDNHAEARIDPHGRLSVHGWPTDVRRLLRSLSAAPENELG